MTERSWLYNGQTAGTPIGTLAGTGSSTPVIDSGGSATFQTATPYEGTSYARFAYPASGSTGVFQYLAPAASSTDHAWTFAFRLRSDLTGNTNAIIAQFRTSGGTLYTIRLVWVSGVPTLHLFAGSTDLGQVGGINIDETGTTWYRVSGVVDGDTGAYSIRLRSGTDDTMYGSAFSGTNAGMVGTINAGSGSTAGLRVGQLSVVAQAITIDIDYVVFNDGGTTELSRPLTLLDTPVITLVDTEDPSTIGATDGSITISWAAVAGAASYDVAIADGTVTSGFSATATGVTSPHTFNGLDAGPYTYAVKAKV